MTNLKRILLGAVGSLFISAAGVSGAVAADPVMVTPLPSPGVPSAPEFSWDRAYIGVYGGLWDCCGAMVGINAGKNFQLGSHVVVGLDLMAGLYDFTAIDWETYALARAGVLLTPRVLLFGAVGIGWEDRWFSLSRLALRLL